MPSVSLWAYSVEILFLICEKEKPAGFSFSLFHGKGRNGKRQLAAAGSLRGNEPSQALRASSPEGRAKTVEGAFLVSFSKGYQGHTGSASCLSLWERWMRPTGADGEGAPAPLRGAAAVAAEGPSNRRNAKNAFSEAASIFPLRLLLWDYQGRAAPCLQRRRPPPAADTGRSCWGSGLQDASAAQGTKQTQGAATRRIQRVEIAGAFLVLFCAAKENISGDNALS